MGRRGIRGSRARAWAGAALATLACAGAELAPPAHPDAPLASGVVFHDRDGDGARDRGEWGVRGVAVSNGRDVVRTDWRGRYRIPVPHDGAVFVVKPRGYATPHDENGLPRFYHLHRPQGSPAGLGYPGVEPTGPLPEAIDFPLTRVRESEEFRVLLFGDTQPYTLQELDFLARDVVEPLIGADVAFGMTLGDLVGDDLSLFEPLNAIVGRIGAPWHNVIGNHDMNLRAASDAHANETFERVYGPATHAFQVGRVHFVVLDDVIYEGWNGQEQRPGRYEAGFRDDQIEFLRNYLAGVPRRDLVVLAMHIPLDGFREYAPQRRALFDALADHPHALSLSGHTHTQYHRFFSDEDGVPPGRTHHHLNQATAAGSWWLGALDEVGIPHATMRDGAPNGYSILSFDGNRYSVEFRAARRPADYQMHVIAPASVRAEDAAQTEVIVNVFAGSERSTVEMRLGADGAWRALERRERVDPLYVELVERERGLETRDGHPLPTPEKSRHLWVGTLPPDPARGTARLEVRTRDMFGHVYTANRLIRIE
ncbi:MAG TPA: calcineurin-like phosphoesterase family protein [Myxococcota bacterium]